MVQRESSHLDLGEGASFRRARLPQPRSEKWKLGVLLIEDDAADSALVVDVLKRHARVREVRAFDTPEVALFQLARGRLRPDLILLDIQMPRISGFKFLEALDEIPAMNDTPVVMLTTSRLREDVERARRGFVQGYVIKPDSYEELRERLDAVVKQAIDSSWGK
jgi:CheY-like chemotaxis protein